MNIDATLERAIKQCEARPHYSRAVALYLTQEQWRQVRTSELLYKRCRFPMSKEEEAEMGRECAVGLYAGLPVRLVYKSPHVTMLNSQAIVPIPEEAE